MNRVKNAIGADVKPPIHDTIFFDAAGRGIAQQLLHTGLASQARQVFVLPVNPIRLINWELSLIVRLPFGPLFTALIAALAASFRSRTALHLEILALRHQVGVLQRSVKRPKLTPADRLLWAWLCTVWQDWKSWVFIMKAPTVVGWHRKGFRLFWTWKIRRGKLGRPTVPMEVRDLIQTMSRENPLWGAPRIHGELLKLGIEIGETSVGKYMVRGRKPPSQTWRTFLENHVKSLVSVDFFAVQAIRFQILYVFLVLAHDRRRIVHFAVTAHPTAEWTAQQMREVFPWDTAPRYLLRDRDRIFGKDFVDQVKAMGIKQVLSAAAVALAACVHAASSKAFRHGDMNFPRCVSLPTRRRYAMCGRLLGVHSSISAAPLLGL
jgi:putative transposase